MKHLAFEMVGEKDLCQRVWERILREEDEFSVMAVCGPDRAADVGEYLQRLEKGGYIALTRPGRKVMQRCWRLIKNNGAEAPRLQINGQPKKDGLANEQIWRTLRLLKSEVTVRELAALATTAEINVSEVMTRRYMQVLHRAGYLRHKTGGRGRYGEQRYKLITNSGPRPPELRVRVTLFDPNLNAEVWIKPENELN